MLVNEDGCGCLGIATNIIVINPEKCVEIDIWEKHKLHILVSYNMERQLLKDSVTIQIISC